MELVRKALYTGRYRPSGKAHSLPLISFRNVRVDETNRVHVCDFDMATEIDSMRSGVPEKTGTVPFMAVSLLRGISDHHSLVHDCESVFWICALSFLKSTAMGNFKDRTIASTKAII